MTITKPIVVPPWADTATPTTDIVQPTDPEISQGWPLSSIPPSRQRFNWVLNYCANAVRYFMRAGIGSWDALDTYATNDRVRGSDGAIYRALQTSTNQDPTSAFDYWARESPGGEPWRIITTGSTLRAGQKVITDNGAGPATYTLPASPADGDVIRFAQGATRWTINGVAVLRNGKTIGGLAEDMLVEGDMDFSDFELRWSVSRNTWVPAIVGVMGDF